MFILVEMFLILERLKKMGNKQIGGKKDGIKCSLVPRKKPVALEPSVDWQRRRLLFGLAGAGLTAGSAVLLKRFLSSRVQKASVPPDDKMPASLPALEVHLAAVRHEGEDSSRHVIKAIKEVKPDVALWELGEVSYSGELERALFEQMLVGFYYADTYKRKQEIESLQKSARESGNPEDTFAANVLTELIGRNIPILGAEHPTATEVNELSKLALVNELNGNLADRAFSTGLFEPALNAWKKFTDSLLASAELRDRRIVEDLNNGTLLRKLIARYPHLSEKKKVSLLLPIGAEHSPLADELVHPGSVYYQTRPEMGAPVAAERELHPDGWRLKKRREITDQTLARSLLAAKIIQMQPIADKFSNIANAYALALANKFSFEEIKAFQEQVKHSGKPISKESLHSFLKLKNVHGLNASRQQMETFVINHFNKLGFKNVGFETWRRLRHR